MRALRFNSLTLDPSATHLPGRLLAHPISPRGTTPPRPGPLQLWRRPQLFPLTVCMIITHRTCSLPAPRNARESGSARAAVVPRGAPCIDASGCTAALVCFRGIWHTMTPRQSVQEWVEDACSEDTDVEVVRLAMASRSLLARHVVSAVPKISVVGEW